LQDGRPKATRRVSAQRPLKVKRKSAMDCISIRLYVQRYAVVSNAQEMRYSVFRAMLRLCLSWNAPIRWVRERFPASSSTTQGERALYRSNPGATTLGTSSYATSQMRNEQEAQNQVIFLENFSDELRRKAPVGK